VFDLEICKVKLRLTSGQQRYPSAGSRETERQPLADSASRSGDQDAFAFDVSQGRLLFLRLYYTCGLQKSTTVTLT
jgi:hypothetical protein